MKLYYTKGACSLASRIIINELGLNPEYESVDLKTKKTENDEDYLKINPKGSVPALLLDNKDLLTENAVILQYLADTHHATNLLPPLNDFERYRILEWVNFISSDLHKTIGTLFASNLNEEAKTNLIIPLIKRKIGFVEKQLSKNKFLVEDHFTLADAYLFVMIHWLKFFKFDFNEWPNLSRYFEALKKHPSIKKSLEQEQIHLATA